MGKHDMDDILPHIMDNGWSKQAYLRGFDFDPDTYKDYVNMFKQMETNECIYEGLIVFLSKEGISWPF